MNRLPVIHPIDTKPLDEAMALLRSLPKPQVCDLEAAAIKRSIAMHTEIIREILGDIERQTDARPRLQLILNGLIRERDILERILEERL